MSILTTITTGGYLDSVLSIAIDGYLQLQETEPVIVVRGPRDLTLIELMLLRRRISPKPTLNVSHISDIYLSSNATIVVETVNASEIGPGAVHALSITTTQNFRSAVTGVRQSIRKFKDSDVVKARTEMRKTRVSLTKKRNDHE